MAKKSAYDEARDLFGRVGAGAQSLYNKAYSSVQRNESPAQFFTKTYGPQIQQGFNTVAQRVGSAVRPVISPVPDVGMNRVVNPVRSYAGDVVQGMIQRFPSQVASSVRVSPPAQLGQYIQSGLNRSFVAPPVKQQLGQMGNALTLALDIGTLPFGAGVARNIGAQAAKQTLKSAVKQGIASGAKYGSAYGFLNSLYEGKDEKDNLKYALDVIGKTGLGGVAGSVLGGGVAGAAHGVGAFLSLLKRTPKVDQQLRDAMGRWVAGEKPIKPKGMSLAAWDFQLRFNKKYNRNPYEPVYPSTLEKAVAYEAERRIGFQARDINKDRFPLGKPSTLQPPTQATGGISKLNRADLIKQFEDIGTVRINFPESKYGIAIKDEGDFIAVNFGTNDLSVIGTEPSGSKAFKTIDEALNFVEQFKKYPKLLVGEIGKGGVGGVSEGVTKVQAPSTKRLTLIEKAQEEALQTRRISPRPSLGYKKTGLSEKTLLSSGDQGTPGTPGGLSRPSGRSITQDKYAFNVNMERLDLTKPQKQTLRTTIETIKPDLQRIKGKTLSNDEVIKTAKTSEILSEVTTREQTLQAEAATLKARQSMVSLDKEIDVMVKNGDTQQLQTKMRDLVDSLRVVSSTAADTGRRLQSLSIEAGDESIRVKILKEVSKTETDTDKILREAANVDWDNANSIAAFYRKFIKPSTMEILDEFRYNNMLSNPRTHLRNAFSNLMQTFFTRPATLLAQGKVGETAQYYRGAFRSLPDAFEAFSKSFTGKEAITKPDLEHIKTLKLLRFLTVPTRAMEAADKFFSAMIQGGEIARGATTQQAEDIAKYSLFRQDLAPKGQGVLLNKIDNATRGFYELGKRFAPIRWFVPFVRTPMNFAKQWIEYSPAGLATLPGAINKQEQLAKTMVGSLITLTGAKLALDGNTTWAAPIDREEKDLFYASGKKPYSFRVGDNWVSMQYAGPFAYALALPAAVKYYMTENRTALTDTQLQKLAKISSSMAEFLSGQTFMEGLGNFVSLFKGDVDFTLGKNLGYTASQLIPLQGLVKWVSTIIDPVYRKATTAKEQIISGIPFVSQSLEGYTIPSGEPSVRERRNLLTPYDITKENPQYDKQAEIRKLQLQQNVIKNQSKKLKEEAIKLFLQGGQDDKVKQMLQDNKVRLESEDIKSYQKSQLRKAAELFVEENDTAAKQILRDAKVQLTDIEVKKAAKRKAIELFRLGLDEDVKKIVRRYGIVLTEKDVR